MKIPVVADLPVGENLQDQVVGDGVEYFTPYAGVSITMNMADSLFSGWAYSLFGSGANSWNILKFYKGLWAFLESLKFDETSYLKKLSIIVKTFNSVKFHFLWKLEILVETFISRNVLPTKELLDEKIFNFNVNINLMKT